MFLGARAESASGNWWMKEPQQQLCCSLQLQDEEGSGWFCAPRGEAAEGTTGSQHQPQGGCAPEELQGELSPPNPWAWDVETFCLFPYGATGRWRSTNTSGDTWKEEGSALLPAAVPAPAVTGWVPRTHGAHRERRTPFTASPALNNAGIQANVCLKPITERNRAV